MTIDEAIEGLENEIKEAEAEGALVAVVYLNLGIEALKRVKRDRFEVGSEHYIRLSGETEA